MTGTIKGVVKHRYDTAANLTAADSLLLAGELVIESDTNKFKYGDGVTLWTLLDYAGGGTESVYDTAANLTSDNPTLTEGQLGIESDTRKFKFGDGTTDWNTLLYAGGGSQSWDLTADYIEGDQTTHTKEQWNALADNNNSEPGVGADWQKSGRLYWFDYKEYILGDLVIDGGFTWRCLTTDTGTTPGTDSSIWELYTNQNGTGMSYYTTGWINNTDWTNTTLNITHNLGSDSPGLITKIFFSATGSDSDAQEVPLVNSTGTAFYGLSIFNTDVNGFYIHTGQTGVIVMNPSNGQHTLLGASTSYYYKIVTYKPNETDIIFPIDSVTHKYDTGWITPADWSNATENIAHGLGADMEDLVIQGWIKNDDYGIQDCLLRQVSSGGSYGASTKSTGDQNNFDLELAQLGLLLQRPSDGQWYPVTDGAGGAYRLIVYRPELITENVTDVTTKYDTGWISAPTAGSIYTIQHNLDNTIDNLIIVGQGRDAGGVEGRLVLIDGNGTLQYGGSYLSNAGNLNNFLYQGGNGASALIMEAGGLTNIATEVKFIVYNPNVIAEYLPIGNVTYKYDTGWIANSDWTNVDFNIAHSLDAPLSDIMWKFMISTDGTDENSFGVDQFNMIYDGAGEEINGLNSYAGDNNNFTIHTGSSGIRIVNNTNGGRTNIGGQAWYYKVIAYKPELITENVTEVQDVVMNSSQEYTITSNDTDTQIDATNCSPSQTLTLVSGTGAFFGNKVTLNNLSANLIIVTDNTTTYWCEAGSTTSFWFSGSSLKRSAGKGLYFEDLTNAANSSVVPGTDTPDSTVSIGDSYELIWSSGATPASTFSGILNVLFDTTTQNAYTTTASDTSTLRSYWQASGQVFRNENAAYSIKKMYKIYK